MTRLKEAMRGQVLEWRQQKGGGSAVERAVAEIADEIRDALAEGNTYQVIASALAQHMIGNGFSAEEAATVDRKSVSEAARALGIYARPGRAKAKGKPVARPAAGTVLAGGRHRSQPVPRPAAGPVVASGQQPGQPVVRPAAVETPAASQPAPQPISEPVANPTPAAPAAAPAPAPAAVQPAGGAVPAAGPIRPSDLIKKDQQDQPKPPMASRTVRPDEGF